MLYCAGSCAIIWSMYSFICNDCPRNCGAFRDENIGEGFCGCPALPLVARAAPHFGEEPCISGERGSGTVFFSGCNLSCVFCQNISISSEPVGKMMSASELAECFLRLRDKNVHNLNLVTGTPYARVIAEALDMASLDIPVIWNSSGYESIETLEILDPYVSVYMPDLKYLKPEMAKRYSAAPDYPEIATAAIKKMYEHKGNYVLDKNGMLLSGVLIRHLIMPGWEMNTMDCIDWVAENFEEDAVLFSLMSQYTPMGKFEKYPELNERIDAEANLNMRIYMEKRGISGGFWQEVSSGTDEMIPDFDLTGTN